MACIYASLILADDNIAIKGEKIAAILKAANYEIEPYWPGLFANAMEGVNVSDLMKNVGSAPVAGGAPAAAGGAAPAAAAAAAKPDAAAKEAPKKEEKKAKDESDAEDDMGFGLFD